MTVQILRMKKILKNKIMTVKKVTIRRMYLTMILKKIKRNLKMMKQKKKMTILTRRRK